MSKLPNNSSYVHHPHLQRRPLHPRALPLRRREAHAVDRHRRHQGCVHRAERREDAVPQTVGAACPQGRCYPAHPRQGTGTGVPRGFRQVPVAHQRDGTGALSARALQDVRLRWQGGVHRQRQPYRRGHRDEGRKYPQLRGRHPHRRPCDCGTGNAAVR